MGTSLLQLPNIAIRFHVKHAAANLENKDAEVVQDTMAEKAMFHVKHTAPTNLLLAGGRSPALAWLEAASKLASYDVYCADKGVATALAAGFKPKLVVGDCDSGSKADYERAQGLGAAIAIHPTAKDDTDLQLLLAQLAGDTLVVSGIWGGRFDHLLSNVYSLLAFKNKHRCQVLLADEQELMLLLCSGEAVTLELSALEAVQALSLLPLSANTTVSLKGVQWPLENASVTQQYPYAISNVPVNSEVECSCSDGCLGLYIHWQS